MLVVTLLAGCSVGGIDFSGKGCSAEAPCPDGFACVANQCQKAAQPSACSPAFTVTVFKRAWVTPHTVRWSWKPEGKGEDFVQYKLALGKTADELESARQLALTGSNDGLGGAVWTQKDNPELGQYGLRLSNGTDPVSATTTDGLTPGTEYQARLLVYDAAGCVYTTDVVHAVTAAPSSLSYVLFDDQGHPQGKARPPEATLQTDAAKAYEGDRYIAPPPSAEAARSASPPPPVVSSPAPASTVLLRIETTPKGATATVRGKPVGTTPVDLHLDRSDESVLVVLTHRGYAPRKERVIPNMSQRLVLTLTPLPHATPARQREIPKFR